MGTEVELRRPQDEETRRTNRQERDLVTMGKQQVGTRLKEVVYTLSPFEQNVMGGLFKDFPHKVMHHMKQNIIFDFVPFFALPVAAIGWYCADYNEREKQRHRY